MIMFVFVDNVWRISLPFIHLFNVYWTFRYICERASRRRRTSALHIKDESINLCLCACLLILALADETNSNTHTRRISHVFHSNKATVWHPKHSPAPLHILNTQIHSTHNPHIATNTHIIKAVYYIVISRFVRSLSPSSSLAFITYKIINSNFPIHNCLGFFFLPLDKYMIVRKSWMRGRVCQSLPESELSCSFYASCSPPGMRNKNGIYRYDDDVAAASALVKFIFWRKM